MYHRLCNPLKSNSFFLFGARGTGKTQLLKHLFRDDSTVLWIDLLSKGETLKFTKSPSLLSQTIKGLTTKPSFVVIDEVQRAPSLLNEVHKLIEEEKILFALTGSSARKLKRGGANLLAGRALLNHLYPLSVQELASDFHLESVLCWGTLPAVVNNQDKEVRTSILQTYVDVYLREEILEEQIVRSLDPFARFLEAAAQSNGSIVNFSKIAREASSDAKSIMRYFQILEDTLLGFFLEPYHRIIRKRQRVQSKFYFFDCGVKRALEGAGALRIPVRRQTYEWGKAFEHFIILEAIRMNSYTRSQFRLSYLRTQGELEIDLIAERKGDITWAIEIKSSEQIDAVEVRKLKALVQDIPNSKAVIFYDGAVSLVVEDVSVYPWKVGLETLFSFTTPASGPKKLGK